MKKIFSALALFGAMIFSSCSSCSHTDKQDEKQVEVLTIDNVNEIISKDLQSVKDTFPEVKFYECQILFTEPVTSSQIGIDEICAVCQAGEYSYQFVHSADSSRVIKVHDYWLEDVAFNPDSVITLDSALTRLQMADIVKPNSKMVCLRCPLGPKIVNPGYYFGQTSTGFVKVDGKNGKVESVK